MLARSRVATVWRGLRWRSPKSFRIPTLNEGYTELFNSKKGGWKMNTRNVLMLFLSLAIPLAAANAAIDRKEGCSASFSCNGCAILEEECDDCTGWGWLTWTKAYTNCDGGTTYNDDCDGCLWDLPWGYVFCQVPDSPVPEKVFDVDLDVSTTGTEIQPDCSCDSTGTDASCHWDVTVHREWEYDKESAWVVDKSIKHVPCTAVQMVLGSTFSHTTGTQTTITTGWSFSSSVGVESDGLKAEFGSTYSYSESETLSHGIGESHEVQPADVGRYIAGTTIQDRIKCSGTAKKYGCSGLIASYSGDFRRAQQPSPTWVYGDTAADCYNQEVNTSIMTSDTLGQTY